jgi:uncharacterized protein (TIGR04222 family)
MNGNPFDLRGPEFLVFYAVLSTVVSLLFWQWRQWQEGGSRNIDETTARTVAGDPYMTAYLRAGPGEVVRVAVASLLDRKLLVAKGPELVAPDPDAAGKARRPLDKAILSRFASQNRAQLLFQDAVTLAEAEAVGEPLRSVGLIPDARVQQARLCRFLAALAILWGVAIIKIVIALQRGHYNVLFLCAMALVMVLVLFLMSFRFRTSQGDRILARIQQMLTGLKTRKPILQAADSSGEISFLMGAFGIAVLPAEMQEQMLPLGLKPPPPAANDNSYWYWGSSCSGSSCSGNSSSSHSGSSCGSGGGSSSSSCSGGSSSCGGGGGGCGGCGGG